MKSVVVRINNVEAEALEELLEGCPPALARLQTKVKQVRAQLQRAAAEKETKR